MDLSDLNDSTILIVDDNQSQSQLVEDFLREEGFQVIVARDGKSAIQSLEYDNPDLILLDVVMPGMDGFEVCDRIKVNPSTRDIPVIFMTALTDAESKVKAFNIGAVDCITKQFQKEEVLARIKTHLALRFLSRSVSEKNKQLQREIDERLEAEKALQQLNQDLDRRVAERTAELERALRNVQQMQLQLVQNEKMSTLGHLVAGVAHEINNPIGFIKGNIEHAEIYIEDLIAILRLYQEKFPNPGETIQSFSDEIDIDYLSEDFPSLIASMKVGIERIYQISVSLRNFSRSDTTNPIKTDIHEGIDSTLLILKHRLKANDIRPAIEINKQYGNLPLVECYPGQLNQVFMNIIANAVDAIDEACEQQSPDSMHPYKVTISTCLHEQEKAVSIIIKDNGMGMSEAVKNRIFDHLFTTKPVGKGTGVGLSISYQIVVEKHHGELTCHSIPGVGTEFDIKIPLQITGTEAKIDQQ